MRTFLVSDWQWHLRHPAIAYRVLAHVGNRIKHPDKGSNFDRAVPKRYRKLPSTVLIALLLRKRYDGIIIYDNEARKVIGDLYFQRHGQELHMFSIDVAPDCQRQNFGSILTKWFFEYAWDKGYRLARYAAGGKKSAVVDKLREKAVAGRIQLAFIVSNGAKGKKGPGWVTLRRK